MAQVSDSAEPTVAADTLAPSPESRAGVHPVPGESITSLATGNTYTIGEPIGEGHFGVVYGCEDVWENALAAKVLKSISTYDALKASAEREIHRLLLLRHPYVTYAFDAFEFRDAFYIITERCYRPLTALFELPALDGAQWVLPVGRCLLQAVHYLHLNQHVHQDIHVGNVFIAFSRDEMNPQNTAAAVHFKLGDLGIAKLFSELGAENTRAQWMLPPEVLSPEDNGPIDHRVDIYHVGLLLLQLASSREMTFTREEVLAGRPRELALALPPPFNFAIEKTLRRRAVYRTSSAMELWRDLHGLGYADEADAEPLVQALLANENQRSAPE